MIYFGTSGFSYKDWVGVFYPAGMPQRDWLSFYAREFNSCEINSTYGHDAFLLEVEEETRLIKPFLEKTLHK